MDAAMTRIHDSFDRVIKRNKLARQLGEDGFCESN
jgi:hypothetical protein